MVTEVHTVGYNSITSQRVTGAATECEGELQQVLLQYHNTVITTENKQRFTLRQQRTKLR